MTPQTLIIVGARMRSGVGARKHSDIKLKIEDTSEAVRHKARMRTAGSIKDYPDI